MKSLNPSSQTLFNLKEASLNVTRYSTATEQRRSKAKYCGHSPTHKCYARNVLVCAEKDSCIRYAVDGE
jgi:hypothetical protein